MTTTFVEDAADGTAWVWFRVGLDLAAVPRASRRCQPDESPIACVERVLRASGNAVRARSLQTSNLAAVPIGTVVQLSPTSGVAVVVRASSDRLWLESETGRASVAATDLEQLPEATALDWHPAARGTPMRTLARLVLGRHELRRGLSAFVVLSIAARLAMLGVPFLVRAALARVIPDGLVTSLGSIGIGLAVLGGMIGILGAARDYALRYLEGHVVEKYQREVFRRFQELPFRAVVQRPPLFEWQQLSKFTRWSNLVSDWVVACFDAVFGLPFLFAAAFLSPSAAAASGAFAFLCLLSAWLAARAQAPKLDHVVSAREHKHEAAHALVHAMELARTDGLRAPMLAEFERRARREHRADLEVADWRSFTLGVSNFAERASWLIPLSVVGWQCMIGEATLATCIATIQLVSLFALAVREAMGAIEKSVEIRGLETFATAWETPPPPPPEEAAPAPGYAIDVRDVSFRYRPGAAWVLENFSLRMRPGEHRVLRWPSGTGKTTLLRLIAGLHAPDRGAVLVQRRHEPAAGDRRGRRDVSYVPQTTPLLEDTLRENLNHLSGGAPEARILEAARRTGLDELVARWPMGWETLLSGRVLSSGQRQLVTMTAVLASEASIVLLDETTAHLDATLRARLEGAFEGRTVLTVDHRHESPEAV